VCANLAKIAALFPSRIVQNVNMRIAHGGDVLMVVDASCRAICSPAVIQGLCSMLSSDDLDIDLLRNILETVHHVLILGEKVGISRNAQRNSCKCVLMVRCFWRAG
jgi:hypothetical protein